MGASKQSEPFGPRQLIPPFGSAVRAIALVEAAGFDRAFLARWTDIFLMDELSPFHVAEVACLQLQRHWQQYGIEVRYIAPELIMAAVEGNEEFKSYGVRQLAAYIQMKTNDGIANARKFWSHPGQFKRQRARSAYRRAG